MPKRKGISASLRWQVFKDDDFRCRYCGRQAGEDGVVLHVDHVLSIADGGTDARVNLVTSCQRCNGGKGAVSLASVPACIETVASVDRVTVSLKEQAEAIARNRRALQETRQQMVNLLCAAFHTSSIRMSDKDVDRFVYLSSLHGAELVADWIRQAALRRVRATQCLRYVHGIIRTIREESGVVR